MSFAIPRAWCSYGAMDWNGVDNVNNARAGGIPYVDVYMFPCRGKDAADQVNELISNLGTTNYGTIWLDIETNPSGGCGWDQASGDDNCQYISELVQAVQNNGRVVGIYSNYYMWESIVGDSQGCANFKDIPLWYAHYDGVDSFDDFYNSPFGGWEKPAMK